MQHRRIYIKVLILMGILLALPVHAANVDGKGGIGFEDTLTGVGLRQSLFNVGDAPDVRPAGLAARYWIGNVGLETIFGASLKFGQQLGHAGFWSLGAHYAMFRAPNVNLSVGARGIFAWANTTDDDHALGSRYGFALEIPIRVEYFLSANFAIAAAIGPVLHFPSPWRADKTGIPIAVRNPLTAETSTWDVALTRGEFSGGLGFTYYFN